MTDNNNKTQLEKFLSDAAEARGDINTISTALSLIDQSAIDEAFLKAVIDNDVNIAERLIAFVEPDMNDYDALHSASMEGHVGMVKMLIKYCNVADSNALERALYHQNHEIVRLLIPHSNVDKNSAAALKMACAIGNIDVLSDVIKKTSMEWGQCGLYAACENGNTEAVNLLLPWTKPKQDGSRALYMSLISGNKELIYKMLDLCDKRDYTSIMFKVCNMNYGEENVDVLFDYCHLENAKQRIYFMGAKGKTVDYFLQRCDALEIKGNLQDAIDSDRKTTKKKNKI